MAKNYWEKWDYGIWLKDDALSSCQPATRGIWVDAISRMMDAGTDRISGTVDQLAQKCRCKPCAMARAVDDLRDTKAADVSEQNGIITVINRKRLRELEIKRLRKISGSSGGASTQANLKLVTEFATDFPTNVPLSVSDSVVNPGGGEGGRATWMDDEDFKTAWSEWETHRKEIGKTITPLAGKKLLKQCALMGKERAIAAINHSITRQWRGIFEDKNAPQNTPPSTTVPRHPTGIRRESWQIEKDIASVRQQMEKVLSAVLYGYAGPLEKAKEMAAKGDVKAAEDVATWQRLKARRIELETELRNL